MGTIFISYRRDDDAGYTGWLKDTIEAVVKDKHDIFFDIDTIAPGTDFKDEIAQRVKSCHALIATIGKNWTNMTDSNGNRRLFNSDDLVRIEIETALNRTPPIPVFPFLLPGAKMPSSQEIPDSLAPLLKLHAPETNLPSFRTSCVGLANSLIAKLEPRTGEAIAPKGVDDERAEYWSGLAAVLRSSNWPLPLRGDAPRNGFYSFTLDRQRGIYLYAYRDTAKQRIGAYVSLLAGPLSKVIFERLERDRTAIERSLAQKVDWLPITPPSNYRIHIDKKGVDTSSRNDWPNQHQWLASTLSALRATFVPLIDALPARDVLQNEIHQ